MGNTQFCDVCGTEILHSQPYHPEESAGFYRHGKSIDLCRHCGDAVETFLKELKAKHEMLRKFKLLDLKGQKELGDFEQRE